jgi:hypothetical protein
MVYLICLQPPFKYMAWVQAMHSTNMTMLHADAAMLHHVYSSWKEATTECINRLKTQNS